MTMMMTGRISNLCPTKSSTLANLADEFSEREFPMLPQDFDKIKNIAYQLTGIKLSESKKNMIYGRLARRLRALSLKNLAEYCQIIQNKDSEELGDFINAITTNLTSFFRETHHFDSLLDEVLPFLIEANRLTKKIRIWSAGCSTGEEPYSIAMTLKE